MRKGIKVLPQGSASHIEFDGLKDMQDVVGGYIECVSEPGDNFDIYVNEEGILQGLPLNVLASMISGRRLLGPVLVTGRVDKDGEITSVPKGVMTTLHQTAMLMEMSGVPVGHPHWDTIQDA